MGWTAVNAASGSGSVKEDRKRQKTEQKVVLFGVLRPLHPRAHAVRAASLHLCSHLYHGCSLCTLCCSPGRCLVRDQRRGRPSTDRACQSAAQCLLALAPTRIALSGCPLCLA
jgi:hypothetical protein